MSLEDRVLEAYARLKSVRAVARELETPRSTVNYWVKKHKLKAQKEEAQQERLDILHPEEIQYPATYILTSAQNNTRVNQTVWENLLAYAEYRNARVIVGGYTYNQNEEEIWYDQRLKPYLHTGNNIKLAPDLLWCGRANIIPTAVRPLSGFETYCGKSSGIFPHAKFALESLPGMKHTGARINYTTGTVTQRNYLQRKAGIKAEHHHAYGAVIVEVDYDGTWFVRQLNADSKGVICDLDCTIEGGKVTTGHRVEAIVWGDIHQAKLKSFQDQMMITQELAPRFQFVHDLLDFEARRHHNRNNPHELFSLFVKGRDSVEQEVKQAAELVAWMAEDPDTSIVVVNSNHDDDLQRWLRETDYRSDPENALFFLKMQLATYEHIAWGHDFHSLSYACHLCSDIPTNVTFLDRDESFTMNDIEYGMHGHLGPNGARGTPNNLARLGSKANTAHTHSAKIIDGLYVAGVTASLDQGYNVGPSSWTHSHVITYWNGKRAIITTQDGKFRGNLPS